MTRRAFLKGSGALLASVAASDFFAMSNALAQSAGSMVRVLTDGAPNTLDPDGNGLNRYSYNIAWNVYDRLVTFGKKALPDGKSFIYDYQQIVSQLAESFETSADGTKLTFHLRQNATFHDGSPVTARDVKWSLDRAVTMPASRSQMASGSMTSPDQFVVVDDHTFTVTVPRRDRFTLQDLAVTFPSVINSTLAKSHATAADPWAADWLKSNAAGGGPFKIESYQAGQQVIFTRFDQWRNGDLPKVGKIVFQVVESPASRRAAAQRGDADIVMELPPRDIDSLKKEGKVRISDVPYSNGFQLLAMNNKMAPFDNPLVRQAIAFAIPYQALYDTVLLGRGAPLFGGMNTTATSTAFPVKMPYNTDLEKAKKLLAQAGMANGFSTTFSFDAAQSATAESIAVLVQESLAKIGVKITINKVPSGQLGSMEQNKTLPFFFEQSGAWLAYPDYFLRTFFSGDTRWNYGSYSNPKFVELLKDVRYENDPAKYDAMVKDMITMVMQDVPVIMLWQPNQDVVFGPKLSGFDYMFHRQLEFRYLAKS